MAKPKPITVLERRTDLLLRAVKGEFRNPPYGKDGAVELQRLWDAAATDPVEEEGGDG